MGEYEKWHWRALTFGVRVFGLFSLAVAFGFVTHAMIIVGVVVAAIGVPFLLVRPFRPDLGDTSWIVDPIGVRSNSTKRRCWWTGDEY